MPASEVRPLGLSDEDWEVLKSAGFPTRKEMDEQFSQKVLDIATQDEVSCPQVESNSAIDAAAKKQQEHTMTLTFKSLSKNGRAAIYAFGRNSVRFALGSFADKKYPNAIEASPSEGASFVEPAAPKVKLTAEERKAQRAAKPKPTLAERAAAAQKRAEKLAAQAAAAAQM